MAEFFIFVDKENFIALAGNPEDRTDEEIQVVTIPEMGRDYTLFALRNGDRINVQLSMGEIALNLQPANKPVSVKGTRHAHRT